MGKALGDTKGALSVEVALDDIIREQRKQGERLGSRSLRFRPSGLDEELHSYVRSSRPSSKRRSRREHEYEDSDCHSECCCHRQRKQLKKDRDCRPIVYNFYGTRPCIIHGAAASTSDTSPLLNEPQVLPDYGLTSQPSHFSSPYDYGTGSPAHSPSRRLKHRQVVEMGEVTDGGTMAEEEDEVQIIRSVRQVVPRLVNGETICLDDD
eukprot:Protomagalhaensia_sp_Gyna_25__2954@NODE_2737_length_919_cov_78_650000_g2283_i0_p1_GENE_NODE_2737_length_919_cov_78_650000_g2283_i0NODE_2737_length_919_cov_78_650000_g2283_i0_p1_ORF_typecomplete_len217_score7_52FYTT/PF07078_11/0_055_NODE_2737_length_919_cov_78_650000_g2283_i028651